MPIYEYRCRRCGHVLEVLQKLNDPPPSRCEKCPGKLEKLISRTSFQLKGSGWFAQGYGGTNSKTPAEPKAAGQDTKTPPSDSAGAGGSDAKTKAPADSGKKSGKASAA